MRCLGVVPCRWARFVVVLVAITPFFWAGPGHASGEPVPFRDRVDGFLSTLGSGDEYDPEKRIDFGIIPGPFYTPEMKLGLGIAAIGLYKVNREDEEERISTLSLSGFGSITGAIGLNVVNHTFFLRDRVRFFVEGRIQDVPEKYWGVGYETNSDDSVEEDYDDVTFQAFPKVYICLLSPLYVGGGFSFIYNRANDTEPGGLFDEDNPHGTTVYSSGFSLHMMYDSRDYITNPYEGSFFNIDYYDYSKSLGSDSDYQVTELTASSYWGVAPKTILAAQCFLRHADGDVPWTGMSKIGGAHQMRGYWEGRYRDRSMVTSQVELRRKLDWRHGVVFWVGAGAIAPSFDAFDADEILPNAGVGYRLAFKDRSNVRIDLGFGKNEVGFYFNVNEAF